VTAAPPVRPCPWVHFYSYATGVSFELPVGFEHDGADGSSAAYADRPDALSPGSVVPRVRVLLVGQIESGGPAAVAGLADGFAHSEGAVLERRERLVDGWPAETVVLRRQADSAVLQQSVVAADTRLLSIIAVAPADRAAQLLPAYEAALDSIRLIAP
jgi:hypothetical protein